MLCTRLAAPLQRLNAARTHLAAGNMAQRGTKRRASSAAMAEDASGRSAAGHSGNPEGLHAHLQGLGAPPPACARVERPRTCVRSHAQRATHPTPAPARAGPGGLHQHVVDAVSCRCARTRAHAHACMQRARVAGAAPMPRPLHPACAAVEEASKRLLAAGFQHISEKSPWSITVRAWQGGAPRPLCPRSAALRVQAMMQAARCRPFPPPLPARLHRPPRCMRVHPCSPAAATSSHATAPPSARSLWARSTRQVREHAVGKKESVAFEPLHARYVLGGACVAHQGAIQWRA